MMVTINSTIMIIRANVTPINDQRSSGEIPATSEPKQIVAVNQSYSIKFIPSLLDIGDGVFNNIIELEVILCIIELDLMTAVFVIIG